MLIEKLKLSEKVSKLYYKHEIILYSFSNKRLIKNVHFNDTYKSFNAGVQNVSQNQRLLDIMLIQGNHLKQICR